MKNVQSWLSQTEIKEVNERISSDEVEAGGGINLTVPTVLSFFSKLKFSSKNSNSIKELITSNIEPRLSELIELCNSLITEVKLGIGRKARQQKKYFSYCRRFRQATI